MTGMDVYRISFYDAFLCTGASCTETCCRGWKIFVEEEALKRYRREKGLSGLKLFLFVRGKKDAVLNVSRRKCPFLERSGLCEMQRKHGEDFMPLTCRVYPRRRLHLGIRSEELLNLSCVEAARLFLEETEMPHFVRLSMEVDYGRSTTNDDTAYLRDLLDSRDRLMTCLENRTTPDSLSDAFDEMLFLSAEWQLQAAAGKPLFREKEKKESKEGSRSLFPLPVGILNAWMNGCLYHDEIRSRFPFLYKVMRLYFKRFDKLTEAEGQIRLDHLFRDFFRRDQYDTGRYARYAAYCLLRRYPEAYEDYSFLKYVRIAVMCANLLALLHALWTDEYGSLPEEEAARLLAVLEKRIFHSAGTEKEMLKKWQERERDVLYGQGS